MAFSALPGLVDALVSTFTTALADEDVTVYDGPAVSDDVTDFLMVGVEDPWADEHPPGDSTRTWATYGSGAAQGSNIEERGSITCIAHRCDGDGDMKAARDALYAVLSACWDAVKVDTSLGVAGVSWVNFETTALRQAQTDFGAEALMVFNVSFYAYLSGAS